MRGVRILGVDLSLTATGVSLNDGRIRQHRLIRTDNKQHIEERKDLICRYILRYAKRSSVDLVLFERLNSGSRFQDNRPAQVYGAVSRELWKRDIPYAEVASNTVKLYATGNGRADKPVMVAAAEALGVDLSMYPKSLRDNVADAIHVARWGVHHRHELGV